ncbi:MAG: hypothetical protein SOW66_03175, partial [Porphyromonas sp.]|nr:hypothetical protein [Porphyromonas sp.]
MNQKSATNRILTVVCSVATLLGATSIFSSCQEDAPQINHTVNISVTNDFSKVVEAINNGSLKNEEAIAKLSTAINKMGSDQSAKLAAITEAINSASNSLSTKLATIEAALKAQSLTLESKLGLLQLAVDKQTLKQEELGNKLAMAVDQLGSSVGERLAAIEGVIQSSSATQAT